MPMLYILRHAKAAALAAGAEDFDRPLAERGIEDAAALGQRLGDEGFAPALVLCSAARRARETLAGILPGIEGECHIEIRADLYTFNANAVLYRVSELPADIGSVLVVGHNPALEETARVLAGHGATGAMIALGKSFPTCAFAELSVAGDSWSSLGPKSAALERLITPDR